MSSSVIEVRPPAPGDVAALAAAARRADVDEASALGWTRIADGIAASLAGSAWARTVTVGGALFGIFGVVPPRVIVGPAAPWAVGTDLVTQRPGVFLTEARRAVAGMLDSYPWLANYVHAENVRAVRWLRLAGFTIAPAAPFGPLDALFHRFDLRRP